MVGIFFWFRFKKKFAGLPEAPVVKYEPVVLAGESEEIDVDDDDIISTWARGGWGPLAEFPPVPPMSGPRTWGGAFLGAFARTGEAAVQTAEAAAEEADDDFVDTESHLAEESYDSSFINDSQVISNGTSSWVPSSEATTQQTTQASLPHDSFTDRV